MAQSNMAGSNSRRTIAITDSVESQSRRIARIWSTAAVLLFVGLALTVGIPHGPALEDWERWAHFGTILLLIVATAIAWKWEGWGGSIMLIGSVALGVLAALQHQPLVAFLPAAAFLIPAIAFLIAWHRTRTRASVVVLATVVIMILFTGSVLAQEFYDRGFGPTHPSSGLPAPPDTPVMWMWSGGVTDTSAIVVARISGQDDVELLLDDPGGAAVPFPGSQIRDVWRFELSDLDPGTTYRYYLTMGATEVPERTGTFTTRTSGPTSFRVAIASCARLGSNGTVFETILGTDPDLFISSGDLFYADHAEHAGHYTDAYSETLTQPAQAALYAEVPIAYVWDDHDFGGNDSDSTAPTKQLAIDAYLTNVPHYPLPGGDSVNQAFSIGRVQFVLLDARSQRNPKTDTDGPDKTMLGPAQLEWLEERLLDPEYALTVIVSSVPWIAVPEDGADHWAGYSHERRIIADFIADHDLDNIVMVTGDAHLVGADDGTNTDYSASGNAAFPLLHAAALDRPGSVKGGPFSEGMVPGGGQFGLIDVTDDGSSEINVHFTGMNWLGEALIEYSFNIQTAEATP